MPKTCLIVDDSKVIRKVARHMFEALDFSVSEACDGSEALAMCAASMPDLILLDWNMPVMNGIEFLRAIRDERGPDTPKIVFCTTENGAADLNIAIEAGADEYVMKPFDRETLEAKLSFIGAV